MRAKTNRKLILYLLIAAGAAGFLLRRWQLLTAFDEAGLVLSGNLSVWVPAVFAVIVMVFLAVTALGLRRRSEYTESFSSGTPEMIATVCSAAMVLTGSVLAMVWGERTAILTALGVAGALSMAVIGMQRYRGVVPSAAIHLIPCAYLILALIVDFRRWSVDPTVLDYCYDLFAAIGAVCAMVNLMGFCFDKGRRRETAFWCLAGCFFAMTAMGGLGVVRCLTTGGLAVFLGANAWQLLEE